MVAYKWFKLWNTSSIFKNSRYISMWKLDQLVGLHESFLTSSGAVAMLILFASHIHHFSLLKQFKLAVCSFFWYSEMYGYILTDFCKNVVSYLTLSLNLLRNWKHTSLYKICLSGNLIQYSLHIDTMYMFNKYLGLNDK